MPPDLQQLPRPFSPVMPPDSQQRPFSPVMPPDLQQPGMQQPRPAPAVMPPSYRPGSAVMPMQGLKQAMMQKMMRRK
jgi:hypothetical protein